MQQQPQTKCLVCDNVLALIGSAAAAVAATGTAPVPRLSVSCPVGKKLYVLLCVVWCASVSQCAK